MVQPEYELSLVVIIGENCSSYGGIVAEIGPVH